MFEKIVVPLDGSDTAETALPYAEEFAHRLNSELVLYHVCGSEHEHFVRMHKVYLDEISRGIEERLRARQAPAMKVTTQIDVGQPAENVCNLVQDQQIGLVIMSAVGASVPRVAHALGSVADEVCRTVPVPVLLIRPEFARRAAGAPQLVSSILVPTDGSELSDRVLPVAEELSQRLNAGITLFRMARIVNPAGLDGADTLGINYLQLTQQQEQLVRSDLLELEKRLQAKGITVASEVTTGTDAAEEIIQIGTKVGADLVVMSTHGRSGIQRWAMGSIAERVLRHGTLPLLLVNARAA